MSEKRKKKDGTDQEILDKLPKSLITFREMRREFSEDGGEDVAE